MKIKVFFNVLKILFKVNIIKTVYFNFKCLPLKQSLKLPFHFYGSTNFESLEGKIILNPETIHFGMISFGGSHERVVSSKNSTRLLIKGEVVFKGFSKFGKGVNLVIWKNGKVVFGTNFSVGSNSNIISYKNILFGNNCLISWQCDFYDTDFHFIENIHNKEVNDNCGDLIIRNNVWFGARCIVLKNTIIPSNCIVGAKSLCKGNLLKKYGENIILGGNPAVLIKKDYAYIFDKKKENNLLKKYVNY